MWFQLLPKMDATINIRCANNLEKSLRRRTATLLLVTRPKPLTFHSRLTEEQIRRIDINRTRALTIQRSQLQRPHTPRNWVHSVFPETPNDFKTFSVDLPTVSWLAHLNEHGRDRRLVFVAETHTYFIDGQATLGSVTSLIHAFCEDFEEKSIITKMMNSGRWPRPGYLLLPAKESTINDLRLCSEAHDLVCMLCGDLVDEEKICCEI